MKSLKTKVMASLAMLLVAAVMMTSSSFAWYTISTKGDISKVKVKMTATDTMEIAIAETEPGEVALGNTLNQQTWGTTAVYDAASTSQLFQVADFSPSGTVTSEPTKPASGSECKLWTPEYDETNRLLSTLSPAATKAEATYASDKATPVVMMDNNGNECAYVYDFWVRSNKYSVAYMKDNDSHFTGNGTTGTITVAFVDLDTGKVIGVWDKNDQSTFSWSLHAGSGENEEYQLGHVGVYTYVNGSAIKGKDIDSEEEEAGNLPTFEGSFLIEGTP